MIKVYLTYSLPVLKMNIVFSPLFGFFASILKKNFSEQGITLDDYIYLFMLSFLTGGFLLGTLLFEFSRRREYYFYYNLGISKLKLIGFTYLLHLILTVPIMMIAHYAKYL
jgi:hypothetical protein